MRNTRRITRRERKNKRLAREQETRIVLSPMDMAAKREAYFIGRHTQQTIHAPRINKTYQLDGFTIPSGKYHRHIG